MIKKTLLLLLFILTLVCCSILGLFFLPSFTDSWLIPRLTENLPYATREINLLRVSPWQLHGSVILADGEQERLILPDISLHFSPTALLNGVIDRIEINGGTIHLRVKKTKKERVDEKTVTDYPLLLPAICNSLSVKNSTIFLHTETRTTFFMINGSAQTRFKSTDTGRKQLQGVQAEIELDGSLPLTADFRVKENRKGYAIHVTATLPDIGPATVSVPFLHGYSSTGSLFMEGDFETEGMEAITRAEINGTATDLHISSPHGSLDSSAGKPVLIQIRKKENKIFSTVRGLNFSGTTSGSVDLTGEYDLSDNSFSGSVHSRLHSPEIPMAISFSGRRIKQRTTIRFTAKTEAPSGDKASSITVSPVTLNGDFTLEKDHLNGLVQGTAHSLLIKKKTALKNISFSIPVHFPLPEKKKSTGRFSVDTVSYENTTVAGLEGSLGYTRNGAVFTVGARAAFQPDLFLQCEGTFTLPALLAGECRLLETEVDSASLPSFITPPPEMSFSGTIQAAARFAVKNSIFSGSAQTSLSNGRFAQGETRLEGININLTLPDLPHFRSSPGQLCTVDSILLGKISLTDSHIRFRIEDSQSVFIEKGGFSWCGGQVESSSFRLSPTSEKLKTTLYCDRLKFTQLLDQFGIKDTEGEGSLNGKLPVILSKKGITFDNGFLFSTPGHSGIVHFNNTGQLRENMPGIDQTPYLDYSMQALENFSYNWTRLTFNSEADNLLIKMQLDGKPATPLPFGYKNGRIISTKQGTGLQHPVRLDLNFRLPLTELFRYGKNMQSIMENMQ
ncbi:intermembrane phospholipid transport protein YdbH family protein [Desulfomarina sp.]